MAKFERYLRLDPSGEFSWITIDRDEFLEGLYAAIDCSMIEHVNLRYGFECIVDESGWFSPYQRANFYASRLYEGFFRGVPLIGPVVFVRTDFNDDGEPDWFPLKSFQLPLLERYLWIEIPDPEV